MINPKDLRAGQFVIFGDKVQKKVTNRSHIDVEFDNSDHISLVSMLWEIAEVKKEAWELAYEEWMAYEERMFTPNPVKSQRLFFQEIWNKYK